MQCSTFPRLFLITRLSLLLSLFKPSSPLYSQPSSKMKLFAVLPLLPLLVSSAPVPAPVTPGLEAALSAAFSGTTTPTPILLARATTTENGLTTDPCKALTLIYARGTNEDGNVGTVVGPSLIADLRSSLGTDKVTAQGVDYAANVLGYLLGGDPDGTSEMISLVNSTVTKCPSTKIVLGGYRFVGSGYWYWQIC